MARLASGWSHCHWQNDDRPSRQGIAPASGGGLFKIDFALAPPSPTSERSSLEERNHQGLDNVIPFPELSADQPRDGPIQCHERLGGLLKYYHRGVG